MQRGPIFKFEFHITANQTYLFQTQCNEDLH